MSGNIPQWPCWSFIANEVWRKQRVLDLQWQNVVCHLRSVSWGTYPPWSGCISSLQLCAMSLCSQAAPGDFGSRWDASSPTLRSSSSYSLPSSLARSRIRGWDGPLTDILAYVQSHTSRCTSEILIDPPSEQCCTRFTKLWRGCGTAMGVGHRSLETLITDSLSPGTARGQPSCMAAGMNDTIHSQASLETAHSSDLVLGSEQREDSGSGCSFLPCCGRTCKLGGSPWGDQTLAYFKTLLSRQSKSYFSTNQGKLPWEMVGPASLEVFKSRMGSFLEDVF